jgi:very-short-patch-repair endonuclease
LAELTEERTLLHRMANQRARQLRREMTEAERKLWLRLRDWRPAGYHFRRQAPLGPFIADFACLHASLVVELDGGQHTEQVAEDSRRTAYLAEHGFRVLRFWNNQVFTELDDVLETIWLALTSAHTLDPPGQPWGGPGLVFGEARQVQPPRPVKAVRLFLSPHPNPPLRGEGDLACGPAGGR